MFRNQAGRSFEETVFNYQDGITDHVKELAGEDALTPVQRLAGGKKGEGPGGQTRVQMQNQRGPDLFQ